MPKIPVILGLKPISIRNWHVGFHFVKPLLTSVLVFAEREVWYPGGFLPGGRDDTYNGAC